MPASCFLSDQFWQVSVAVLYGEGLLLDIKSSPCSLNSSIQQDQHRWDVSPICNRAIKFTCWLYTLLLLFHNAMLNEQLPDLCLVHKHYFGAVILPFLIEVFQVKVSEERTHLNAVFQLFSLPCVSFFFNWRRWCKFSWVLREPDYEILHLLVVLEIELKFNKRYAHKCVSNLHPVVR